MDKLLQSIHDFTRVQFWCCQPSVFINAMKRFYQLYPKEIEKYEWAIFYFGTALLKRKQFKVMFYVSLTLIS